METGTTAELYVLTPDEVRWIERALGVRDAMARAAIAGARGRELRCDGGGNGAPCGELPTHYARHSSSGLKLYCRTHWKDWKDSGEASGQPDTEAVGQRTEPPSPSETAE